MGGRSGVGKTTVAEQGSAVLLGMGVAHCLVDGDNLDAAYPKAADDPYGTALTPANLRGCGPTTPLWATTGSSA